MPKSYKSMAGMVAACALGLIILAVWLAGELYATGKVPFIALFFFPFFWVLNSLPSIFPAELGITLGIIAQLLSCALIICFAKWIYRRYFRQPDQD